MGLVMRYNLLQYRMLLPVFCCPWMYRILFLGISFQMENDRLSAMINLSSSRYIFQEKSGAVVNSLTKYKYVHLITTLRNTVWKYVLFPTPLRASSRSINAFCNGHVWQPLVILLDKRIHFGHPDCNTEYRWQRPSPNLNLDLFHQWLDHWERADPLVKLKWWKDPCAWLVWLARTWAVFGMATMQCQEFESRLQTSFVFHTSMVHYFQLLGKYG